MSNYDSTRLDDFKGVWVICEQNEGKLLQTSFELVSEARRLADELGLEVSGLLLGDSVENLACELGAYGADRIYVCENPLLGVYTTDGYAKVVCDLIMDKKPEIVIFSASSIGRDLAPRCAARLRTGLTADCTHFDISSENYIEFLKATSNIDVDNLEHEIDDHNLKMTLPGFGGHLMATIVCPHHRPCMVTVCPGVMQATTYDQYKTKKNIIEKLAVKLCESDIRTEVVEVVKALKQQVDLIGSEVIVAVGRGISRDVETGIKLAEELAKAFGGGVIGCSRATIDSGWFSVDHMVGQTGKTVRPKIYVTLGISGATQHVVGMQDAGCIIAVDKNENAPIFEVADYCLVGDLFKIVPDIINQLASVK